MEFKSNKKKQLAAAVTLAVMGAAWAGMPGQAFADSAQIGSDTTPVTWEYYSTDPNHEISDNRNDKSGANVFAAQYHQNFNDNKWAAFGDMSGKSLTISSMSVEAIQGKDGVGAAAGDTVKEGAFGQAGGMASVQGVYSTNISNAVIAVSGDVTLSALGGKTYSDATSGGTFQHQGQKGIDGSTDAALKGGEGAKGGIGGKAVATGIEIGNGQNISITGGSLTVSAVAEQGGHGGYGGEGGIGAAGTDGNKGITYTQEYLAGQTAKQAGQTDAQAANNGHTGKTGGVGTAAVAGSTGGTGGNGAAGGDGGTATANGLKINNITNASIALNGLTVTATAGNGNAGGQGGKGGQGGVGGTGGEGGNGSFGEKGGDLDSADLTAADNGAAVTTSNTLGTASASTVGTYDTVTTITTQHQTLSGNTYGGAGGDGGAGATGAVGGAGGVGGNGGNGGQGGAATAAGFTGSGLKMNVNLGAVTVTAAGGDGAKGGLGGDGGDGGNGGFGGKGGQAGQAGSNHVYTGSQDQKTTSIQKYVGITSTDSTSHVTSYGWVKDGAAFVYGPEIINLNVSNAEANRTEANDGKGGVGGTGGKGGVGGTVGTNGTSGAGGSAASTGLAFTGSEINLKATAITAAATAGNGVGTIAASGTDKTDGADGTAGDAATDINGTDGGEGGDGGTGSTKHDAITQSSNGADAKANALTTTGGMLKVVSDSGLAIEAKAENAAVSNSAKAVTAVKSDNVYALKGDFTVTATATGDVNSADYATGDGGTTWTGYKAAATNTKTDATGFTINGGSMIADVTGKFTVEAKADGGETKNLAQGMAVDNTTVKVHTTGAIEIKATAGVSTDTTQQIAQGIEGNKNNLEFVSENGGIKVTALGGTGTGLNKEYSVWTYDSQITFDAKDAAEGIVLNGDVAVVTNKTTTSILNLKSDTTVNGTESDGGHSKGSITITGSTMNLTDNLSTLKVAATTVLNGSSVYFFDDNNQADKYNGTDYRTIDTKDLTATGTNDLFMRTNANGVYGQAVGSDQILVSAEGGSTTATGNGTYNITVFDQGMRNGYNNADGVANKGHLLDNVKLIENADASGTYNINEMQYDNGVWSYEYAGKVELVNGSLNLTEINTKAAVQSTAQKTAQDANKIAAGAAVTLFGADETLMERLGDIRNSGDDNDGVWAKYVGGKIKVDGLQGDNDFKYNGFAAGYDREVGNNWRIGLAGQYAKGDTTLTGGDGEIKAAAGALYGTWTGDKGHHVDIIAKVGKVDSETSSYGGTIAQKLDGDFGSTALSFAVEYGYRQQLNDGWFIEPMARASYVRLGSDDYTVTTRDGSMNVTNDSMNSIILRGGFLLGKTFAESSNVYLKAAILHDFDGDLNTSIRADGRTAGYSESIGGTGFEYGLGVNHKFNSDSSMYLDVERVIGGDVTKNWGVNVGFRYSF